MIANTPSPPYYAVIFTSTRTEGLASEQDGFLGVESARNDVGITVSYWRDLQAVKQWREHAEHTIARNKGRTDWYKAFKTRIARVERDYGFERNS
jgi:heme-degrading monooxygenase HmoA